MSSMPITIRRAGPADAEVLHDLAAQTFAMACPPGSPQADIDAFIASQLSVASFRRYLADPLRVLLIATVDDTPVGYSMLVRGPITDRQVAAVVDETISIELSKFYLLADRHGSGVAATLMTATLTAAAATGAKYCWLGVNQLNERAARFYAKHGFERVGDKRFLVGDTWHDDHVRLRRLIPA